MSAIQKVTSEYYYEIAQLRFAPDCQIVKIWYANSQKAAQKLVVELNLKNYSITCVTPEKVKKSPKCESLSVLMSKGGKEHC